MSDLMLGIIVGLLIAAAIALAIDYFYEKHS